MDKTEPKRACNNCSLSPEALVDYGKLNDGRVQLWPQACVPFQELPVSATLVPAVGSGSMERETPRFPAGARTTRGTPLPWDRIPASAGWALRSGLPGTPGRPWGRPGSGSRCWMPPRPGCGWARPPPPGAPVLSLPTMNTAIFRCYCVQPMKVLDFV